jgi:hypothetical protein
MFVPPVASPKSRAKTSKQSTDVARRGPDIPEHRNSQQEMVDPGAQDARLRVSWDFSKTPSFSSRSVGSLQKLPRFLSRRSQAQTKFKVGAISDPLEREADRVAEEAVRIPEPDCSNGSTQLQTGSLQPRLRVGAAGKPVEWDLSGPSPDSFRGRGSPLPAPVRGDFERRFHYSFGDVRVHDGSDAAESAHSIGARAYTWGRQIVFGAGEYLPGAPDGRKLLAHELAHVVQQGPGHPLVQRSPLSDSVKSAWDADHKIETLLARLEQPDVQTPQGQADADVDSMIAKELASQPDDLWVAQRIRKGELGKTTGQFGPKAAGKAVQRPIEAFFFRGSTDRRALVIAGVHGTERQGIEVARDLIHDLQSGPPPVFTAIIVPRLFPDNAEAFPGNPVGAKGSRESGPTPTNRNFPSPSEDLAAATAAGGGKAVDASKDAKGKRTREILPENQLLLQLIEKFHPERILSIHGTSGPGSAGVFYDPRSLRPDEMKAARDWARGNAYMQIPPDEQAEPGGQERLQELEDRLYQQRLAQMSSQAGDTDRDLSLKAAQKIDTDTVSIPGREKRNMSREGESAKTSAAQQAARQAHPSIGGNVGPQGRIDNPKWSGSVPGGVSLGSYAPPRGISVFTIEPALDLNTDDYAKMKGDVSQANRKIELQAYADAVRTILLGA